MKKEKLKCGHREFNKGHCGEMICPNYYGKYMHK